MTEGVCIGKRRLVSGGKRDKARPEKAVVWSGSAGRKQRDHGGGLVAGSHVVMEGGEAGWLRLLENGECGEASQGTRNDGCLGQHPL